MKFNFISCGIIITISLVAILNFNYLIGSDISVVMNLNSLEALADNEGGNSDFGGEELRIALCADGIEEYISCEWSPELTSECDRYKERECTPGNNPSIEEGFINNQNCVKFGHLFIPSSCFKVCNRCGLKIQTCKD